MQREVKYDPIPELTTTLCPDDDPEYGGHLKMNLHRTKPTFFFSTVVTGQQGQTQPMD